MPEYWSVHRHVYPGSSSLHVPLFSQGEASHSSMSMKIIWKEGKNVHSETHIIYMSNNTRFSWQYTVLGKSWGWGQGCLSTWSQRLKADKQPWTHPRVSLKLYIIETKSSVIWFITNGPSMINLFISWAVTMARLINHKYHGFFSC